MGESLVGRSAIVTGAGSGIGRAVALSLALEGANIVACDLGCSVEGLGSDKSSATAVADECQKLGVGAVPYCGNVADFDSAGKMVQACVDHFGRVDILCNIAGILLMRMIYEISEEEWDRVIAVNLKGTFNLTRHVLPWMTQRGYGRIVNCFSEEVSPLTGAGVFGLTSYCAAKAGIMSFTYAVAREVARYGITCNAFAPNAGTRISKAWETEARKGDYVPRWVVKKAASEDAILADASYFAALIVHLASEAARDINGYLFFSQAGTIGLWEYPRITERFIKDWRTSGPWLVEEMADVLPKLVAGSTQPVPDYYRDRTGR